MSLLNEKMPVHVPPWHERNMMVYDPSLTSRFLGEYQCPSCSLPPTPEAEASETDWIKCRRCRVEYSKSAASVELGGNRYNGPVMPFERETLEVDIETLESKEEETIEQWAQKIFGVVQPEYDWSEKPGAELRDTTLPGGIVYRQRVRNQFTAIIGR